MRGEVMRWLLDSDPVIRWQVMRDLGGEDGASVDRERSKIEREGWGRALLERQRADGRWGGGASVPLWQSTLGALELLCAFGLDPAGDRAQRALALVEERVTWGPEFGDTPFFEGETEPCINGRVLLIGAAFGRPSRRLMERLLGEQLEDGGWNCEAERGSSRSSFHTTICVLEGLLACVGCWGASGELADSIARGREYLLERRLFRRASTGEPIIDRKGARDWARFAFPSAWRYDLVRGLDFLRRSGASPDGRVREAVDLVRASRRPDGRWGPHYPHPDPVGWAMEPDADAPSRWNTLRAMRVLDWAAGGAAANAAPARRGATAPY